MLKENNTPDLVVCGSIALDDIKTPFGEVKCAIGGSAIYASIAASLFAHPGIVSVIGEDFPKKNLKLLKSKGISLEGITLKGKNLRWGCRYEFDMSEAKTLKTELNSLAGYKPEVPLEYQKTKFLFLGNIDPVVQKAVAEKCQNAFVILDTMNYWIKDHNKALRSVIELADVVVLNDAEARQFCSQVNLVKAAKEILRLGPKFVIIKKGEHGALLFSDNEHFSAPGYPLEEVRDPTGAGDSFAGALTGYLAKVGKADFKTIRKGMIYASAVASFCTEEFSIGRLTKLNNLLIEERYEQFKKIREF